MTLEQTIAAIKNSPSSIFTREDVLKLFNGMELPVSEPHFTQEMADVIIEKISDVLENTDSDSVIDFDSAEFRIDYGKEIMLDYCGTSFSGIKSDLKEAINDLVEDVTVESSKVVVG